MSGPTDLRGTLPNTPTPRELKAARLYAGISLRYLSEGLGLDPATLQAVEDGEISAQDRVLIEWALLILRCPQRKPLAYRLSSSPAAIFGILMLMLAVALAFVTAFIHWGR